QDQKGFFQSLCYNIPIGLAYITSDMRIIETNPLWTKYASNYPMLVGGQKWKALNVILNTNPALVAEELFRNMKPELAIVSAPDGKFFKFQWVPLFGITSIPGFLEIIDDITDEIKTKAQWETTLNSVDEGVILLDMDLNINWTNNLIRRWFNPNQIIPKELYFCSNEMEKENVRANVIRGGKTIRKCVRVEQQNGEMIFQSVISPVRDEYGNVLQLVVIVEDITERENMLDQLRRQAETLNRLHRKSLERIKTLRFTLKLSDALLINDELESIYHILLTIATANEGFGFNRAFLFLYNSKKKTVHGTCGVGQLYPEEVSKVWQELKGITLDDLIKNTSTTM
ncbi:MAG: PAS domain-containing protein, partial [bacterium]